jgi:hypothetical protein
MQNNEWFKRDTYARDVALILSTDWATAKQGGIDAVNLFITRLATSWIRNGDAAIDMQTWCKLMDTIKAEFPDANIISFDETEAYKLLNKRRGYGTH